MRPFSERLGGRFVMQRRLAERARYIFGTTGIGFLGVLGGLIVVIDQGRLAYRTNA
jgi:hypothetical protein